jgi:hypothetical protein
MKLPKGHGEAMGFLTNEDVIAPRDRAQLVPIDAAGKLPG